MQLSIHEAGPASKNKNVDFVAIPMCAVDNAAAGGGLAFSASAIGG
jgi:hypothetical protein